MREQVLVYLLLKCLLLISGTRSEDHKVAKSNGWKLITGENKELPKVLKEFRSFANSVKHDENVSGKKVETLTDERHAEDEDNDDEDITSQLTDSTVNKFQPETLSDIKKYKSQGGLPQGIMMGKTVSKSKKAPGKPKKEKENLDVPLDDAGELEDIINKNEDQDTYHDENEDETPGEEENSGNYQLPEGDVEDMSDKNKTPGKGEYSGDDNLPVEKKKRKSKYVPKTQKVKLNKFKNRKYKKPESVRNKNKLKPLPKIHIIPESRSDGYTAQPMMAQAQPQQQVIPAVMDGIPVQEAEVQELPPWESVTPEDIAQGGIPGDGQPAPAVMPTQIAALPPVPVPPPVPMAAPPPPFPSLCPASCETSCTPNCEQSCCDQTAPPPVKPENPEQPKPIRWMERARYEPGPNYPPPPAPPVIARIMTCQASCPARCAPSCDSTCCPPPPPTEPTIIGCNKRSCTPRSCTVGCPVHCCARYISKIHIKSEILGLQHHTHRKQARKMADI